MTGLEGASSGRACAFSIGIDYSRKRVILEPSEQMNIPTDFDFFRIQCCFRGQKLQNYGCVSVLNSRQSRFGNRRYSGC